MESTQSEFFDTAALAAYLAVSKKSIVKWRTAGRLPGATKVSYHWRYRKVEIEKRLLSGQLLIPVYKGK